MDDITVKSLESCAPYEGSHAIEGIRFRHVRDALGVTAWGMNVLELDPGNTGYPEHDHVEDGQEEVYVILTGSVVLEADGESRTLNAGDFARVAPHGETTVPAGESTQSLRWLGQQIATDDRFATSAIRTMYRALTGEEPLSSQTATPRAFEAQEDLFKVIRRQFNRQRPRLQGDGEGARDVAVRACDGLPRRGPRR